MTTEKIRRTLFVRDIRCQADPVSCRILKRTRLDAPTEPRLEATDDEDECRRSLFAEVVGGMLSMVKWSLQQCKKVSIWEEKSAAAGF